ncbi:hypothetical protein PENSPDRAFT_757075 [Peniophora sp. CONT]|nr:hypothetical protein PENSPDRAFT_757075 [Peniophora sp. CONT]
MPIEALKPDILVIIFEIFAKDTPPGDRHPLGWIRLAHVNREWRALILDLPVLWGRVLCSFRSQGAFRTILSRSRTAPLHIWIGDDWSRYFTSVGELASLLPRAREVRLWHARPRFTLPFLETPGDNDYHDPKRVLVAPFLRQLTLDLFPFSISAPRLCELDVHLSSEHTHIHHLPAIVAAFHTLKKLTIGFAGDGIQDDSDESSRSLREENIRDLLKALEHGKRPAEMPYLTDVWIIWCDDLLLKMLWRSLVIPRTANIRYDYDGDDRVPASDEPMQAYLSYDECSSLSIEAPSSNDSTVCEVSVPHAGINGSCSTEYPVGIPQALAHFDRAHIRELRVTAESSPSPTLTWESPKSVSGDKYPSVEHLDLSGAILSGIFTSYAFPRLRTLVIDTTSYKFTDDPMHGFAQALLAREGAPRLKSITVYRLHVSENESNLEEELPIAELYKVADEVIVKIIGWHARATDSKIVRPVVEPTSGQPVVNSAPGGRGRGRRLGANVARNQGQSGARRVQASSTSNPGVNTRPPWR